MCVRMDVNGLMMELSVHHNQLDNLMIRENPAYVQDVLLQNGNKSL